MLFRLDSYARPPGRAEILNFEEGVIRQFEQQMKSVLVKGTELSKEQVELLTTACFLLARGIYNGVESTLPRRYFQLYPDYLDSHESNLNRNPGKPSGRILVATRADLREDYLDDPKSFQRFFTWHKDSRRGHPSGVELLQVAPEFAKRVSKDCKLELETTDVGLWHEQYAILFRPHPTGSHFDIAMIPRGDPRFEDCRKYWRSLRGKAKEIHFPPELVDPDLADRWEEYVNPSERAIHLHPFLAEQLEPFKDELILDAAAGIGCEVVFLKREGFRVRGNEWESKFQTVADSYARRNGQSELTLDGYNWLDFALRYQAFEFGAILLLGNSICLLLRKDERRRALNQMNQILRPGGVLVVDERNFPAMLQNRAAILDSPRGHEFGSIMYCGRSIRGYPLDISDEKVTWACYICQDDVPGDLGDVNKNSIGEFELHPFGESELRDLLLDPLGGAFAEVKTFSDLTEGYRPGAEFYTHIARKRGG